jgi:hypothetical protein
MQLIAASCRIEIAIIYSFTEVLKINFSALNPKIDSAFVVEASIRRN